ncbi:MAG: ribonuclease HII [Chloroflexota bacterium]
MKKFDRSLLPDAPDLSFESTLWQAGTQFVAGIDEAGRGAWAGPVAAAALVLPADPSIAMQLSGVRDSKEMKPAEREYWAGQLVKLALAYGVGFASPAEIDELGIVPATRLASQRALAGLNIPVQHLLLDFLQLPDLALAQTPLVKGDARSLSIAGASVLAKTSRDARMCALDVQYPDYGFAAHKGYGTARHRAALLRLGPCPVHRRSFRPVSEIALPL